MPRRRHAALVFALALGACAQGGGIDSSTIGTLGGAAGGALLGSQIGSGTGNLAATAIGTLVGAFAGREIARNFGDSDQERASVAERQALADNRRITWNNPETGHSGAIAPVRTYTSDDGRTCRVYTHRIEVDGRNETARGTACRQSDGSWQLVS